MVAGVPTSVIACAVVFTWRLNVPVSDTLGSVKATDPLTEAATPALEMSISPEPPDSCANGGPRELTEPFPSESDTCAFETFTSIVPLGSVTVTSPLSVCPRMLRLRPSAPTE